VIVKGKPYMSWQSGDEGCVRLVIVQLYECGLGTEEDLVKAFGRHVNSVQKYLKDFASEGILGLISERRGHQGRWKLTPELRGKILHIVFREGIWKLKGIEQRLLETWHEAVSVPSIQQVLAENGLGEPPPQGRRRHSGPRCLWRVLPPNPGSKSVQAARGRRKAERERATLQEARP
jgi:transposase